MVMYIILVVLAFIFLGGSFFITEKLEEKSSMRHEQLSDELVVRLLEKNKSVMENSILKSIDIVKEQIMDQTENDLKQLSNKTIMEVSEFSDMVLEKINQNHTETVFLYNMLNEKENELKQLQVVKNISSDNKTKGLHSSCKSKKERDIKRQDKQAYQKKKPDTRKIEKPVEKHMEQEADHCEEILQAYSQGEAIPSIARRLGIGSGEVKLIIDLYQGVK